MLKRLFLLMFFSGSLNSFSQDKDGFIVETTDGVFHMTADGRIIRPEPKPDTLRVIILVTLSPNGIAHARRGYVVICEGKEVAYLDCRKKALKMPQVGWGYKIVGR